MLAGLPKAPSRFNPIVNPKRAMQRQQYILRRMRDVGYLSEEKFNRAIAEPLRLNLDQQQFTVKAEYIAEMARKEVYDQYGDTAYISGLRVYTTIRKLDQTAANEGLRKGVFDYDRRHGYRGPEGLVKLPVGKELVDEAIDEALQDREVVGDLIPAVVVETSPKHVTAVTKRGDVISITGDALKFVSRALADKLSPLRPQPGSIVRLQQDEKGVWTLAQLPRVEAALVSIDPADGTIRALTGGFDFGAQGDHQRDGLLHDRDLHRVVVGIVVSPATVR